MGASRNPEWLGKEGTNRGKGKSLNGEGKKFWKGKKHITRKGSKRLREKNGKGGEIGARQGFGR